MPITEANLFYKYSDNTSSQGHTTVSTGIKSLGKYIASNVVQSGLLEVFFDVVTGDESSAGDTEYRCIFIHNAHPTLTLQSPKFWLVAQTGGGANITVALSASGVKASGTTDRQAEALADESDSTNVLSGLTFTNPTTKVAGLALPDIAPNQVHGIWFKRVVPAETQAMADDGVLFKCEGDTAA